MRSRQKIETHYPKFQEYFLRHGRAEREPRVLKPFHIQICKALQGVIRGDLPGGKRNLLILIPPRHGKTFLVRDFVSYAIGCFPDSEFIYVSYASQLAVAQTGNIKTTMQKEWYRNMFEVSLDKEGEAYFTTTQGGVVFGVGVGGPITGFGAGRKRREFGGAIVIDDPMKADDARSQATKEHIIEWYNGVLTSRKNYKDTPTVMIMQRLAPDDLANHVLTTEPELWHVIQIPALQPDGTALWEETKSAASLKRLQIIDPFAFYAQYQQQPQVEGGNILKRDWWQYYDAVKNDYRLNGLTFITADTAMKTKTMNDFTALQLWHAASDYLYLLDTVRRKMEFPELVREAAKFWEAGRQYGVREILIEDKVSGVSLGQVLAERGLPVTMWKPADYEFPEDKVGRAKTTTLYLEAGRILLPLPEDEDGPRPCKQWVNSFIDECAAFNGDESGFDDQVDAYTMAVSFWKTKGGGLDVQNK